MGGEEGPQRAEPWRPGSSSKELHFEEGKGKGREIERTDVKKMKLVRKGEKR